MTDVIQKYVDEGVLNYVEHSTPRRYFLYDGVMDEHNADVYRLVEDLCDEVMKLRNALKIYERERTRYKHSYPEITGAYFLSGGFGKTDNNMLPQYVTIVPAYGCAWEQVYEKTDRTISYEGS